MPVRTAFAAGNFAIELEGVSAGFVKSAQGGGASGEVVVEESGTDGIAHKHLAGVKYEPIIVTFPIGSTSAFHTWIADTLARKYSSKSGAVITTDFDFKERSRLNFFNAFISEITFPALDVGSKDAGLLSVELSPEYTRRQPGSGARLASSGKEKQFSAANFRLKIDKLDCTGVSRIEALPIRLRITESEVGERRGELRTPSLLEVPDLVVTLAESHAQSFHDWHNDFVINGNNGEEAEKSGTLEYLSADLKQVLFSLRFRNLGIFRLTPEPAESGREGLSRVRAEMYCEAIGLQVGAAPVAEAPLRQVRDRVAIPRPPA